MVKVIRSFLLPACVAAVLPAGALAQANCNDFSPADFKKIVLADNLDSPMKMAIAKDGRVFWCQRSGGMRMVKPGSSAVVDIMDIAVRNGANNEDGVLGMALDPNFASNNFVYVFYCPSTQAGYKISRFTLSADKLGDEKVLLTIPHPYPNGSNLIIHGAGGMAFDAAGNLLVGTGDLQVTNGTGGPTPTDPNSTNYDAQRTSANSNSLLGKILRIHPNEDGSYGISAGNLFPQGTAKTLPEIFAMGMRNPFTITVDPKTNWAYVGEVGPDGTGGAIPSQDEVNQIKQAGNFGWPYLTGDNQAYPGFSADNLVNDSKNNTGINHLPAPTKALFYMAMTRSWPINGFYPKSTTVGSRCIKVGGFYRFDPSGTNPARLPPAFDNGFFVANHNQFDSTEAVRFFKLDDNGGLSAIKVFQPTGRLPMAFEAGPDGVLYGVEWGRDNGHWFDQKDGRILRIEYTGTCSTTPIVRALPAVRKGLRSLLNLSAGQAMELPAWSNHAELYDLQGLKRADVRRGPDARAYAPAGIAAGLAYVRYLAD